MIGRRVMRASDRVAGIVRGEYVMTVSTRDPAGFTHLPRVFWFYAVELDGTRTLEVMRSDEVQAVDWVPA